MGVMVRRSLLLVALCAAAACSGSSDEPDATQTTTGAEVADESSEPSDDLTVSTGEMREVPTVPPSTIDGQTQSEQDGVIVVAPTIAPAPPPQADPDQPVESSAPPTTELVGDPQPSPEAPPPEPLPLPEEAPPLPPACDRLVDFGVQQLVGSTVGSSAATEQIDPQACRYVAGNVTVEVYFVPTPVIRDDWYRREGVEPVGEVGGDAVGFGSFITPGGASGDGYTIAITGGRQGVVVGVSGPDARLVAAQVTTLAQQAAG